MNVSFRTQLIAAALAVLAFALCEGCATPNAPIQPGSAAMVEMQFHSFEPKSVTIHAGEAVAWRNTTPLIYHTVTADPNKAESASDVALPPGAEPFDSGHVPSGATYTRVFTVPGTYRYFCVPHESAGMVGEVIVLAAVRPPSPAPVEPAPAPATVPATQPTTQPSTEPATQPATVPETQPTTQATSEPATQPATVPETQPTTQATSEPATLPVTVPATQPTTPATSEPATLPVTVPATQPPLPATSEPATLPATVPATQPTTQASAEGRT